MKPLLRVAFTIAIASFAARDARADAPPSHDQPAPSQDQPAPSQDQAPPSDAIPKKRPLPDYDGLPPEGPSAGEDALWAPRLFLAPVYLVLEYVLRRPLGALMTALERNKIPQRIQYYLTFGNRPRIGIVPTAYVDFGLYPSVGFYFFWDDAFVKYNNLRVRFGTWGPEWISASVSDQYAVAPNSYASVRASFTKRSDFPFFGLGSGSSEDNTSRYAATIFDAGTDYKMTLPYGFQLGALGGFRTVTYDEEGTCCNVPTLQDRIRAGELSSPPRYSDGHYNALYYGGRVVFDDREKRPHPQSGVRVALEGTPASDFSHRPGNSWINYSATAAGFVDLTGQARVLSLTVGTIFVDPLTGRGDQIPFNELAMLGGDGFMRGYIPQRLIDRSAAVATLGYEWPIWSFLDATLQASTGNVFGPHLSGLTPGNLRLTGGAGVRTNRSPENQVEVFAGFGTDTFDSGASITSFRFAIGATRGF